MAGDDDPPPEEGGLASKLLIPQPLLPLELNPTNFSGPPLLPHLPPNQNSLKQSITHANSPPTVAPPPSISLASPNIVPSPQPPTFSPPIANRQFSAPPQPPTLPQPGSYQESPAVLPVASQPFNVPPSNPLVSLPSPSDDHVTGVFQPSQPKVVQPSQPLVTHTVATLPPKPLLTDPAHTTLDASSQPPTPAPSTKLSGTSCTLAFASAADPHAQVNHASLLKPSYAHAARGLAPFYSAEDMQPQPCLDSRTCHATSTSVVKPHQLTMQNQPVQNLVVQPGPSLHQHV
ncbi:hypothetical protein LIER_42376 [Lithospermum erythrorhizon]|uniref:Uncharacterized protein n=1 Tax=Lithospermum erythrorhizon TaxID=34254 RepID=A0AAV3RNL5_LITER